MEHRYSIITDSGNSLKIVDNETRKTIYSGIKEPSPRETLQEARRIRNGLEQSPINLRTKS